jgi:xanthine/CO dehydrogenase XdhC/CoxF family maturation factor
VKELQDLIAAWRALAAGSKAVLATVVATTGSTYRKPGARMLVTEAGWVAGSVSGGCLEGDVLTTAWDRTTKGPALVTYDSTSSDDIVWGFGLGCQGSVTVLFERVDTSGGPLPFLARTIEDREPGVVATIVSGPGLSHRSCVSARTLPEDPIEARSLEFLGSGGCTVEEVNDEQVLFESVQPPLGLTIFGAGHDAIPLVQAAKNLGWYVTVVDHRAAFADKNRFPAADRVLLAAPEAIGQTIQLEAGSAAVVMTHNYLTDLAILGRLLRLPLSYVGQLGPRVRTDRMLEELAADGLSLTAEQSHRLHAPVGLDLGGASPEEVALAVVAEVQAVNRGRSGRMLQDHTGPLHEPSSAALFEGRAESVTCPISP